MFGSERNNLITQTSRYKCIRIRKSQDFLNSTVSASTVQGTCTFSTKIQSTLIISNSKGLSEILRDICTSTYQICRTEEKIIRTTTFNKFICN